MGKQVWPSFIPHVKQKEINVLLLYVENKKHYGLKVYMAIY